MIIGVTGGFGVGKTTFCRFLEEKGAIFLESDTIVHELYSPEKAGFKKIRGYFGEEFVDEKNGVRRDMLRDVVLKNPQKLWILNKLIHPLVKHEIERKLHKIKKSEIVCLEAIYLEKEDLGSFVQKIILIERDPRLILHVRKGRWKLGDINRFLRLSPMAPKSDFVVKNNSSLAALRKQAHEIFQKLR